MLPRGKKAVCRKSGVERFTWKEGRTNFVNRKEGKNKLPKKSTVKLENINQFIIKIRKRTEKNKLIKKETQKTSRLKNEERFEKEILKRKSKKDFFEFSK